MEELKEKPKEGQKTVVDDSHQSLLDWLIIQSIQSGMFSKLLYSFIFLFLLHANCFAQLYPTQYRPPNQHWQQLKTAHFKFVYAPENDRQAIEMAQILESQYPKVQRLVGGQLQNFPIILNNYNDRSNGFVTPFNFRSEIELPPIKGKSLNPQTGSWLTNVGPHELVHALQFSNLGDYNIPQFVSLFSPDLARSIHGALPPGATEGIAVYHETTNIAEHGGRGNYPFFTNQFDATFDSNKRWSMRQLIQPPDYTRPFGRHYIGGYEFITWLHTTYGDKTTRKVLDFYMDFPFLGYGFALRRVTGSWPGKLYDQFEKHHKNKLNADEHDSRFMELNLPFRGREIRRPKWLSDSRLIFYGSFYNARPGFYSYDLNNHSLNHIIATNSVRDFQYTLSNDRSQMVFSYYETDPIYDSTAKTELVSYHFESQQKQQLTQQSRLYAPTFFEDGLFALKSHPGRSKLIALPSTNFNDEQEVFSDPNHEIKAVASRPDQKQLAIISNKKEQQALWITGRSNVAKQLDQEPDVAFESGSVFDPEWHPNEDKILFSSDFSGTMQLYEYNLSQQEILQITNMKFNAFEGSYNPDGNRVAFIRQDKNERLPALIERNDFFNRPISEQRWKTTTRRNLEPVSVISDSITTASQSWETDSYSSSASWLKPRTILPNAEEVSNQNKYKVGLSLHSVNTLSTQAYSGEVTYFKKRGWYDFSYQNKTFWPGFRLRAFNEPSYRAVSNNAFLGRQERSLAFSVPFSIRFNQNIYNTSLSISPELRQSQIRFWDTNFQNAISEFANTTVGDMLVRFNYRLQQNIRDIQPNTGVILFSEIEHYLSGDTVSFSTAERDFQFSAPAQTAWQGGMFAYISPLRQWNQSLRLGMRGLTQSGFIFDNQSLVSNGFSESIFPSSRNLLSFSTRYTAPITYVDDGGLLLPFYLSNIYLVAFSNTVVDPTFSDWHHDSRSVFGLGLRVNFRFGNIGFNIGVGVGYEPTRKQHQFFIGDF
ncbi:hypothetical protein [Fodinibius sp. Rm-B-1B1-1]|uniref:hypothetical protein n=1 Tax=Fodinibius alkaliphilus TaxID=3140241 RepID=UPI00315A64AF